MDVCITKDKKVIVLHDNNLNRMCGKDILTEFYNFDDLPPF